MQGLLTVLPLAGLALLFWLLLLRPQARRQRELTHMQSALNVGDEVMLTSGVYGTVHTIDSDVVHVEIADGVTIRVVRAAVGQVVKPEDESAPYDDQADSDNGEASEEN